MSKEAAQFGKSIKEILGFLNMSQSSFADLVGVTPAAISQIVNGQRLPTLETVIKIVDSVHWSFEELISGKPVSKKIEEGR